MVKAQATGRRFDDDWSCASLGGELGVPREVKDLTCGKRSARTAVTRGVFRELMYEWEEDRLERKIVPVAIERRRPHEHLPAADSMLDERGSAVVESGQHMRAGSRVGHTTRTFGTAVGAHR